MKAHVYEQSLIQVLLSHEMNDSVSAQHFTSVTMGYWIKYNSMEISSIHNFTQHALLEKNYRHYLQQRWSMKYLGSSLK